MPAASATASLTGPFPRDDFAWRPAALFEPRARAAGLSELDLLFAELGRPLEGPVRPDWWLSPPA